MNQGDERQQEILAVLRKHDKGLTLDEIATTLEMSKNGIRSHVVTLVELGFVSHQDKKGIVGRPKRYYTLSDAAPEAVPRQYAWLANALLSTAVRELGTEAVGDLMTCIANETAASVQERLDAAETPKTRLTVINDVMNELGYRSSVQRGDIRRGAVIDARNCVYHSVAQAHKELCDFDLKLLRAAAGGMDVEMEKCMSDGDSLCRFRFTQPSKSPAVEPTRAPCGEHTPAATVQ